MTIKDTYQDASGVLLKVGMEVQHYLYSQHHGKIIEITKDVEFPIIVTWTTAPHSSIQPDTPGEWKDWALRVINGLPIVNRPKGITKQHCKFNRKEAYKNVT